MTCNSWFKPARFGALLALSTIGIAMPAAASVECSGNVTFGESGAQIVTSVPNNKVIDNRCLNDLIVDTELEGANYGSHGEFIAEVAILGVRLVKHHQIVVREYLELVLAASRSEVGNTLRVRVIAFNDFHGNIDGAGLTLRSDADNLFVVTPTGARVGVPAGGVDYMAGMVDQFKAGSPNSVVVSAGDLIGASPLASALFHDEPTIETMNRLGLEFNAVGNHEFDEGREELLRMQNGGCHPT